MMKITYLYHSGIAFETEQCILIVDYYQPVGKAAVLVPEISRLLHSGKQVFVLVSHFHADHLDPVIWTWKQECPKIAYILSRDIQEKGLVGVPAAHFLSPGESFQNDLLSVRAFGSTDEGVSFYIETAGLRIFHAGDLNNWHWNEESTPEEIRESEEAFLHELARIRREVKSLDVLCFPVDARLGHDYMRGPEQFLEQIPSRYFVPIHFTAGGFATAAAFQPIAEKYGASFWKITRECDQITIAASGH